jgi:hypothetical protein
MPDPTTDQAAQPQAPPPAQPPQQPAPPQQSQGPPANGQETIQGMAQRIRTKFPGTYDDKPDDELVHHWITGKPAYSDLLAPTEKAKLPDVNKSLFDPANKGIDPETYSRIYSSYHPAEPAPTGFLNNVAGEAKNIWKGLTAEPEMVEGMDSAMAKGKSAEDAVNSFRAGNYGDAASHAAGVIPVVGSTIEARSQQAKTDPWGAVGAGLTDTAAAAAPFLIDRMLSGESEGPGIRQRGAESLAKTTVPRTMSEAKADLKYGHSAERAIVREGVSNSKQAVAKMDDVGQALDRALTQPKYMGKTVDVEDVVQERAKAHIQDAKRAGNLGAVKRIEDVRDAMLNEYGSLDKSPRAAAAMKTQLYGDVKFTGADGDNEANAFRKDVASGIRDGINDVTGKEIPELNRRYGDLAAAKSAMQRGELSLAQKSIKDNVVGGAVAQGTRKVAQWLGGNKYADPNDIAPVTPAGITRLTPDATTEQSDRAALPAARTPTAANAWLRTTGLPEAGPPPPPSFSGQAQRVLPPSFSARGTEVQTNIGPEAAQPIPMPGKVPGRAAPPSTGEIRDMPGVDVSGQPVGRPQLKPAPLVTPAPGPGVEELQGQLNGLLDQIVKDGPREDVIARAREVDGKLKEAQRSAPPQNTGAIPPAGEVAPTNGAKKAPATAEVSPADQEKADRVEMGQLEARINRYIDQRGGARSPERFAELGQKLRDAKARFNELDAKYPKPEAEETPTQDERPKSTFAGNETAQSTGPRASRTPTFDSMSNEDQAWMSRWAQEIRHLPQAMREGEMKELDQYGQPGDLLKEKIAKRHAGQPNKGGMNLEFLRGSASSEPQAR